MEGVRELLEEIGIEVRLERGQEIQISCPHPEHEDNNPSCSFNLEKKVGFCHGCGRSFTLKKIAELKLGKKMGREIYYSFFPDERPAIDTHLKWIEETLSPLRIHKYEEIEEVNQSSFYQIKMKDGSWKSLVYSKKIGKLVSFSTKNYLKGLCPDPAHPFLYLSKSFKKESLDLYICEGEKDADTLASLGFNTISFSSGSKNLKKGLKKFESFLQLKKKRVFVIFDGDEGGRRAIESASDELKEIGAYVLPLWKYEETKRKDLSDLYYEFKRKGNLRDFKNLISFEDLEDIQWESSVLYSLVEIGFKFPDGTSIDRRAKSLLSGKRAISSALWVSGFGINPEDQDEELLELSYVVNGRIKKLLIERELLHNKQELVKKLEKLKIWVHPRSSSKLTYYLSEFLFLNEEKLRSRQFRAIKRLGWVDDTFVIGSSGVSDGEILNDFGEVLFDRTSPAGKLVHHLDKMSSSLEEKKKEWLEHFRQIFQEEENEGLRLLGAAFVAATLLTSPMNPLREREGFVVHVHGTTSAGKTLTADIASSLLGPASIVRGGWDTTLTALEQSLAVFKNFPIYLDDLSLCQSQKLRHKAIFLIANGVGKARSNPSLSVHRSSGWCTIAVSTGEEPLETASDGSALRVITIPEEINLLKDYTQQASYISKIRAVANNADCCGAIFLSILKKITKKEFKKWLEEKEEVFSSLVSNFKISRQALRRLQKMKYIFFGLLLLEEEEIIKDGQAERTFLNFLRASSSFIEEEKDLFDETIETLKDWTEDDEAIQAGFVRSLSGEYLEKVKNLPEELKNKSRLCFLTLKGLKELKKDHHISRDGLIRALVHRGALVEEKKRIVRLSSGIIRGWIIN